MTTSQASAAPIAIPRMPRRFQLLHRMLEGSGVPCELQLPSGRVLGCGPAQPEFRICLRTERALSRGFDELALADAYVEGEFDLEGDLLRAFDVRAQFADKHRLLARLAAWAGHFLRATTRSNRSVIESHYSRGDDFYLAFIDQRYRFYSHGIFHSPEETIEAASEHKLETMFEALELRPGMRLLDIGGGWGGVAQYCGERGVRVTELTIAPDSHAFIRKLIDERALTAEVHLEDFLDHRPAEPYDAIVIYGVIEHIPDYRRFLARVWECLKPGGRLYLDASAAKEKYAVSAFSRRYVWPGTHTFLCLQDFVQEALFHGFDVIEVKNETRDYELTMLEWARRFDAQREKIVAGWGERTWRAFRLYLWGGCRAFHNDLMQAYHVVCRRRPDRGPRPRLPRRALNFLRQLV